MCSPLPRASLRAHGDTPGTGRECRRPAREGDAPATPLLLPPQLTTVRQSHLDALPRAPEPLTSCPLHILTWRERWGGIKEFVCNRFLCPVPRQDAHSAESSTPPCPLPLTAPSARSKLPFPPPTANARITQDEGAELSLRPIPFPTSSPQIQAERRSPTRGAGSLRGSPALTVCRPAGPAASRPLAAPSGGPRPGPRGRSPRTDSPGPWCALFCGGQGSGPQARAPATRCRDKPCAGGSVGRSPSSSAGHLGSCVTCSPGSAPVSQASPSPELQRGRLGHRPRSAGESLGTGEENRCHQPCSAHKEGHKGSSGGRLGRAGQAGRPQSLLLPEPRPLASWFPGWDNPSPILHTQAETPAHNKTPRTTGTELGEELRSPSPKPQHILSEGARGRVLQNSFGILLWHLNEQPSFRGKVPATPAAQTARDVGAPHSPISARSCSDTFTRRGWGGKAEQRAAQHPFTFPVQRAGLEGAGDNGACARATLEPAWRRRPALPHHRPVAIPAAREVRAGDLTQLIPTHNPVWSSAMAPRSLRGSTGPQEH